MLMLGLNETIYWLVMAHDVNWCGRVLPRDDGNSLCRALEYEVEGQCKREAE